MSNVKTEMAGKRKKATYTVRFSWMDDSTSKIPDLDRRVALAKEIGTETGFCRASVLPQCVAQIVSNAKIAAPEDASVAMFTGNGNASAAKCLTFCRVTKEESTCQIVPDRTLNPIASDQECI